MQLRGKICDPRPAPMSDFDPNLSARDAARPGETLSIRAMKVSVCQLPDELSTSDLAWKRLVRRVENDLPDVVLLNEMPFGPWIARAEVFDASVAAASVQMHESALSDLCELPAAFVSSRPIEGRGKLANEAFLLARGDYHTIHHKHYFPQEPGFFESSWFTPEKAGFEAIEYGGLRIGVLLCTELMFTEWARHYRRQGVHIIVSPRASGTSIRAWDAAARMAAIASGCYVLSSNRVSHRARSEPRFGGRGFVYSPMGELIGETSEAVPFLNVDIDKALVAEAQRNYPCYVREIETPYAAMTSCS
jgi:N-carbamoylputrescine amidase